MAAFINLCCVEGVVCSEPVGVLGLTAGRARGLKQWPKEHKDINQFKKTMDNVPPQEGEYLYELDPRSRGRDHKPVILDKKGRRDLFGARLPLVCFQDLQYLDLDKAYVVFGQWLLQLFVHVRTTGII